MKDLANVDFGEEGGLELKLQDGKLRVLLSYDGKGTDAGLYIDVDPDYFCDKLAEAIPGEIDDKILDLIKLALKAE